MLIIQAFAIECFVSVSRVVREFVIGDFQAGRLVRHCAELVTVGKRASARRTNDLIFHVAFDVRVYRLSRFALLGFECPSLNGAVDLPQVVDAGILLRGSASLDEVGDCDRCQQTDDGHDDHNLHQGKAPLAGCVFLHTNLSVVAAWTKQKAVHY